MTLLTSLRSWLIIGSIYFHALIVDVLSLGAVLATKPTALPFLGPLLKLDKTLCKRKGQSFKNLNSVNPHFKNYVWEVLIKKISNKFELFLQTINH